MAHPDIELRVRDTARYDALASSHVLEHGADALPAGNSSASPAPDHNQDSQPPSHDLKHPQHEDTISPPHSNTPDREPTTTLHDSQLPRDFFALERTWLAYNRTANTLASHAVVVAQLFILHEGRHRIGIACGVVMICGGILVDIVGMVRYLHQSHKLLEGERGTRGRAVVPNWFVVPTGLVFGFVCCGLFVLMLVVA